MQLSYKTYACLLVSIWVSKINGERFMSDWVSIDEDTPQEDFEVIVCSDDDVGLAIFRLCSDGSYYFDGMTNVTHWMPLPAPPVTK